MTGLVLVVAFAALMLGTVRLYKTRPRRTQAATREDLDREAAACAGAFLDDCRALTRRAVQRRQAGTYQQQSTTPPMVG